MTKTYRCVLFFISILSLVIIALTTNDLATVIRQFWFSSGLLLLILLSLIDQPFFSKDANVFVNAITAMLSLLLVETKNQDNLYWLMFFVTWYLIASSYILYLVRSKNLSEENRVIRLFSRINRTVGNPRVLFSVFFLWGAILQFGVNSKQMIGLFIFWLVFLLFNIPDVAKYICEFLSKEKDTNPKQMIGKILGIQSKQIFLVKLVDSKKRPSLKTFDAVEFRYSLVPDQLFRGVIVDFYWLDEEQWVKILANDNVKQALANVQGHENFASDIVYKLDVQSPIQYIDRIVGVITEGSCIEKIRFTYNSKTKIEAGQLLELNVAGKIIYYQLLEGLTRIENLEDKNESASIVGEALQLGVWDASQKKFDKYGWVPEINTPVLLISSTDTNDIPEGYVSIGNIPQTKFPILMDMKTAISHHMAVLGVTGTGKSVFVRNLIRKYASENRKVFIVDFTGEHKKKFSDFKISEFMSDEDGKAVYANFNTINTQMDRFPNQRTPNAIENAQQQIKAKIGEAVNNFITSLDENIKIIELPDVENNQNIFEFTRYFFKTIFALAKQKLNDPTFPQICIVLEEAHTIIPEWNFVADNSKGCQAAINAISQIALQGRKYNVGLIVVAQRTANVSKTVLTQCNSIIAFQQFDRTSVDFLSNYYGEDAANILPMLKFRQAIATGKAFKSTVPLIFEVPEINEQ